MKKLLIVESPGKIKKIKEYLGSDWEVKASVGHISDLPKKELGIDKSNGFKPQYQVSSDKKDVVKNLSFAIKEVGKENVYLATDEDREGEAISFHLCRNLGLDYRTTKRVTFNEITKTAIQKAISNPRTINIPLVTAQEARRVIDRLVGYEISPVLWKKIKTDHSLSAGRVQSVAVKLVVERERSIENFIPVVSFKISALFQTPGENELKASGKFDFKAKEEAIEYLKSTPAKIFRIGSILKAPKKTNPQPPFSTSTLQQDANKRLKFGVDHTMKVAQKLYEGGYITYMRTDSVNLSDTAIAQLSDFIKLEYGDNYLEIRKFKNKTDGAQEAHEAIRPTDFTVKDIEGSEDERSLYKLIYMRAVASQMAAKETDVTTITILADPGSEEYEAKASVVTFDGFTRAYSEDLPEDDSPESEETEIKEALQEGMSLKGIKFFAKESYTRPKSRFGEAELVKELEKRGIGRPSTYASIMKNIKDIKQYIFSGKHDGKKYSTVEITFEDNRITEKNTSVSLGKSSGKLMPNEIAYTLIDFLDSEFADIMEYEFTANCENEFDLIAEGKDKYLPVIQRFYSKLNSCLLSADEKHEDVEGRQRKSSDIGEFEGENISVGKGQYGVFVLHKKIFYNISELNSPEEVNLDLAIKTILDKREFDKKKKEERESNTLYKFGKYLVLNGKYGPYITDSKDSAPVPKWEVENINSFDASKCKEIIKAYKAYKKKKK